MMTMFACRAGHPYMKALLDGSVEYPTMDSTGKYRYADGIYLTYKLNHQIQTGDTELYVEKNGEYFFPTFDPLVETAIKTRCRRSSYIHLAPKFKRVCDKHRLSKFSNMPSEKAYTKHYWVHLNHDSPKASNMSRIDVRTVIPKERYTDVLQKIKTSNET